MDNFKEKLQAPFCNIVEFIYLPVCMLGAPLTFCCLAFEDSQRNNSFLQWIFLLIVDGIAAGIWPFYWIARIVQSFF